MEYNFALNGTISVSVISQKWNTINYADLISNCIGLPLNNPSLSDGNEMWQNCMYTLRHCYPLLQDSPALTLVDPAWAKCDQQIAMHDSPRALIPGKALGPAPPVPTRNMGAPVAAATAAAPVPPAAKPTLTSTPAPSTPASVSSPNSDPPSITGTSTIPSPNPLLPQSTVFKKKSSPNPHRAPIPRHRSRRRDAHIEPPPPTAITVSGALISLGCS